MELGAKYTDAFRRLALRELGQRKATDPDSALPIASESFASMGELAEHLLPAKAIRIAQQAATQSLDSSLEDVAGAKVLASLSGQQPLESQPEIKAVWSHLQRQLWRNIPQPVLTDDPTLDLGAMAGRQVIINPSQFDHPDDKWVVMGHEVAHAELGHSARRSALELLWNSTPIKSEEFVQSCQQAQWDIELEADRRGLQMVADKLSDPAQVLLAFMETQQGPEHPDGLTRATSARVTLREKGVTVSDEVWAGLLKQTQEKRERFHAHALDEEKVRLALKKFV